VQFLERGSQSVRHTVRHSGGENDRGANGRLSPAARFPPPQASASHDWGHCEIRGGLLRAGPPGLRGDHIDLVGAGPTPSTSSSIPPRLSRRRVNFRKCCADAHKDALIDSPAHSSHGRACRRKIVRCGPTTLLAARLSLRHASRRSPQPCCCCECAGVLVDVMRDEQPLTCASRGCRLARTSNEARGLAPRRPADAGPRPAAPAWG
jgi:hypothetical protein